MYYMYYKLEGKDEMKIAILNKLIGRIHFYSTQNK